MSIIPFKKKGAPEVGELVIARVDKVFEYGAYCTLLEYGIQDAFIPWSEVSTKYIKDIRDVIKEGRVVVAKVVRVDKKAPKIQVDISLKRVLENERRVKLLRWKRLQKAQKIVEFAAKNLGKSLEEAYLEVWTKLEGELDPLAVFEDSILEGAEVLLRRSIPKEWGIAIYEEAKKHITIKLVKIRAILKLVTYRSDGIERIRKILMYIQELETPQNTRISVYTIGAPRYRIEIVSPNYKDAEKIYNQIESEVNELARELGIDYIEFIREEVEKGG